MALFTEPQIKKMRRLYLKDKKSISDIADITGWTKGSIRRYLIRDGVVLRSKSEGCFLKGHLKGLNFKGKPRIHSAETIEKIRASLIRRGDIYASGVSIRKTGYVRLTRGAHVNKQLHVVIMEKRLGRKLYADECVHHIDGDRTNNDDDNLALLTFAGHMRLHAFERGLNLKKKNPKV